MTETERKAINGAWEELIGAIGQMIDDDDQIICNHVRRAEGMLKSALVMASTEAEGGSADA